MQAETSPPKPVVVNVPSAGDKSKPLRPSWERGSCSGQDDKLIVKGQNDARPVNSSLEAGILSKEKDQETGGWKWKTFLGRKWKEAQLCILGSKRSPWSTGWRPPACRAVASGDWESVMRSGGGGGVGRDLHIYIMGLFIKNLYYLCILPLIKFFLKNKNNNYSWHSILQVYYIVIRHYIRLVNVCFFSMRWL